MTIKLIESKQLNANIATIKATGDKLNTLIHNTAVQCLLHAKEHGDCGPIARLIEALPKSYRKEGMKVWATHFAPLVLRADGTACLHPKKKEDAANWKVEEANAVPFWDFTKEKTPNPDWDFVKWVSSVKAQLTKKAEEGRVASDNVVLFEEALAHLEKIAEKAPKKEAKTA